MSPLASKLLCALLSVSLSAAFGAAPFLIRTRVGALHPGAADHDRDGNGAVFLAFLLNFGGGVLIANCFCHWLPEVREGGDDCFLV